jgi:hypothetical protein
MEGLKNKIHTIQEDTNADNIFTNNNLDEDNDNCNEDSKTAFKIKKNSKDEEKNGEGSWRLESRAAYCR